MTEDQLEQEVLGWLPYIGNEVDELAEDEESEQAKLKSRWAALEKVVGMRTVPSRPRRSSRS